MFVFFFSVQWTVGGTKGKKKVKPGKGSEKKNATKKKFNKATASGSSDGDSSAESSAPEEGMWGLKSLDTTKCLHFTQATGTLADLEWCSSTCPLV